MIFLWGCGDSGVDAPHLQAWAPCYSTCRGRSASRKGIRTNAKRLTVSTPGRSTNAKLPYKNLAPGRSDHAMSKCSCREFCLMPSAVAHFERALRVSNQFLRACGIAVLPCIRFHSSRKFSAGSPPRCVSYDGKIEMIVLQPFEGQKQSCLGLEIGLNSCRNLQQELLIFVLLPTSVYGKYRGTRESVGRKLSQRLGIRTVPRQVSSLRWERN